tara:strand:+ start:196 stop:1764 length:1569 start_codon:yes stop_codon:yes gene_type:complete
MAADRTLVDAAFKESISRAGVDVPNLKPLYDSNTENMKSYLGIATDAMKEYKVEKETLRIGKNAQLSEFKKIMDKNYEKIVKRKETMPQELVNAVDAEVKRLQDEFEAVNTFGKGDNIENEKARTRITADLQRVIGEAVDARTTFQLLSENKDAWHTNAIKGETIAPMMLMMDLDNMDMDDNVSVSFVNGKLTFNAKNYSQVDDGFGNMVMGGDMSYNLSQMRENLPTINAKKQGAVVDIYKTRTSQAEQDAKGGGKSILNDEELVSNIEAVIDTKEDFRDLALTRIEGVNKESLVSALQNTDPAKGASISLDLLESTFLTTFQLTDVDKDGDIDLQDMEALPEADKALFKENFDKMVNVLTDINDENFDLERSKKVLVNHLKNDITKRYDYTFKGHHDAVMKNVAGNQLVGRVGWLTDPGENRERYVGYRLNKQGGIMYDDKKVAAAIQAGEGFLDPWDNEYIPVYGRDNKFIGYKIRDGVTRLIITQDTEGADGETIVGKEMIVGAGKAKTMAVGIGELN